MPRNALFYAVAPGLHAIWHGVMPRGRTLLSVALDALDAFLTLLHPLLETFLPEDVRGGRRSLALRRSSRTLRRRRRAQRGGRSCHGRRR